MLKKTISVLLVCVIILTAFSRFRVKAQTQSNRAAENQAAVAQKSNEASDLRKIFAKPIVNDSPTIDAKELEKERLNSSGRTGLTRGQKTALYIGIPAAIAAAIIIGVASRKSESASNCGGGVCLAIGICPPPPPPCNR
jgi:hypothetical protein